MILEDDPPFSYVCHPEGDVTFTHGGNPRRARAKTRAGMKGANRSSQACPGTRRALEHGEN